METSTVTVRWPKMMHGVGVTLTTALGFWLPSGCDQGYSIAPSLCDDWCAAEYRISCERDLDPAECVAYCEELRRKEFDDSTSAGLCDDSRREIVACVKAL